MQQYLLLLKKDMTRENIDNEDIIYITAADKYVQIKLRDKRSFLVRTSLRQFEQKLPPGKFSRIHKKYIVCIRHIKFVNTEVTMTNGEELPIGKEFKAKLLSNFIVF